MDARVFPFDQSVVWRPAPEQIRQSNLCRFWQQQGLPDYDALEQKAARDPAWFWDAVLADLDLEFEVPYTRVLDLSAGLHHPRWCVDGRMNVVHNCLDKWQRGDHFDPEARTAVVWEGEDGAALHLTYAELHAQVNQGANALRSLGLGPGDVIGLYMPMVPDAVVAFLAIIRIGGIALPLFSGFGVTAVRHRLRAGGARALVAAAGCRRNGHWIDMGALVDEVRTQVPSLAHVLITGSAPDSPPAANPAAGVHHWNELCRSQPMMGPAASTEADQACLLLYTSGTTGMPKGIVHAHCGFPVKAAQDMAHGFDIRRDDVVCWYSDLGWMMGPWLIFGTLLLGSTMMLYDGAPHYPAADRLWALCARHRVTLLGLSPTLARMLQGQGRDLVARHDLTCLRAIGSTGSPWDPTSWSWIFRHVLEGRKPLLNYTGGTEISGGILGCNWLRPLKPCSFNGPLPGMVADVVDPEGRSVTGRTGELVIRQPWIGMARGFWRDRENRYEETYWRTWPHLWRQGDLAARDDEGFWYVLGRSDDTMNVGGKRLGPAEFEQILNGQATVAESAAVGIPDPLRGQQVVCFCVLQTGIQASAALKQDLLHSVARHLGRPLRPADLVFVPGLPKTRNSKVMRRLIRDIYLRQPVGDVTNLEDETVLQGLAAAIDSAHRTVA